MGKAWLLVGVFWVELLNSIVYMGLFPFPASAKWRFLLKCKNPLGDDCQEGGQPKATDYKDLTRSFISLNKTSSWSFPSMSGILIMQTWVGVMSNSGLLRSVLQRPTQHLQQIIQSCQSKYGCDWVRLKIWDLHPKIQCCVPVCPRINLSSILYLQTGLW